ncbi:MAG: CoA transferase [Pararhodobacter sp.]|nr:CoA transferase [Pararhodobacter sp.]
MATQQIAESWYSLIGGALPDCDMTGIGRGPPGRGLANAVSSNIYPTTDGGKVVIGASLAPMFRRFCATMGWPELADDPLCRDRKARGGNSVQLHAQIGG